MNNCTHQDHHEPTTTTTSRRLIASQSLSLSRGKTQRDASSSNAYVILNWKISMQTEITIDTMHLEDLEIDLFLAAKGRRHARSTSLRFSTYIRRETPWMRGLRDEICKRRSRWSVESTRGSVSDAGCRWNNVYLRKIIYDIGWVVVKTPWLFGGESIFFFYIFVIDS